MRKRLRLRYDEEDRVFYIEQKGWFFWKQVPLEFWHNEEWYFTPKLLKEWSKR